VSKKNIFQKEVNIVLCGEAGQGIKTIELILVNVLKKSGYNIFATKEYMSRIRGGSNSTIIRVSENKVKAMRKKIDILIPLDDKAIGHLEERIDNETIIIADKETINSDHNIIDIPMIKIAKEIGNAIYANVVASGFIYALFNQKIDTLNDYLKLKFSNKGETVLSNNISAALKGYEAGKELYNNKIIKIDIKNNPEILNDYFIDGNDAAGFGALYGGCNFIASYPMSPSTGVLTFLSEHSKEFEIVVEQAEDEIAAINMSIGAWYAGARAMVTTSGGGFALMSEGISLAGIIESPSVMYLAQRPGPATGLPTRTEQGDLELALYAGHGEFPRIIISLTNIENIIKLITKAFNMADRYQIPVIILSDQYLIDTYYNFKSFSSHDRIESCILTTDKSYKRYKLTENGITPRGIPGNGDGLVMVDSDEHDEYGRITEDYNMRISMQNKRMKKMDTIMKDLIEPEFYGSGDYETLIIGWGSTYNCIKEALDSLNNSKIAHLHFSQVYPLNDNIKQYIEKAKTSIIVENNSTAQFAKLIKLKTGMDMKHKILKYNGLHFYVEELIDEIKKILGD
jgi:2-oxoglutarate ferredoxin oxidoreductase subunit alpha